MTQISIKDYNSALTKAENSAVCRCEKDLKERKELNDCFSVKAFPLKENQTNGKRKFGIVFKDKRNGKLYLAEIGTGGFKQLHASTVNCFGELVPEGRVLFPDDMKKMEFLPVLLEIAKKNAEEFLDIVQKFSYKVNGRQKIPRGKIIVVVRNNIVTGFWHQ